jgi:hypothetical protein
MGWLHDLSGKSVKQTIEEYTREQKGKRLLKKCFRGNPAFSGVLWAVWEIDCNDGITRRIISCDVMQYWKTEYGSGWAVKSMDETFGPCHYHCPLSYLDMASGPNSFEDHRFVKGWRETVRSYHAKKKEKRT